MNTAVAVLQNKFGYSAFRLEQERVIAAVLQKRDTFVLMPTGGGKSLCYQIPALLFDGLTIVISPLIALMKDQVDTLRVNGIEAAYLNSTQTYHEQQEILARAADNKIKLLYLAPERLIRYDERGGERSNPGPSLLMESLQRMKIALLAIDEAHCVSQWGHDFRPEYQMLSHITKTLPDTPVIALTATADKLTRNDIVEKLGLRDPAIFVSSFNRANIRYTVEDKRGSKERLISFLHDRKDESGIIYCLSRASTEALADELSRHGLSALPYHAGMEREARAANQEKFLRDEAKIIVATIAFGMGINKSNVRYVVHMDLPKNIEGYYQETGRAGRDGLPSDALLFFSYGDVSKMKKFARIEGNEEQTQIALDKLDQMAAYGSINTCRRKFLLNYFDEPSDEYCGNCDICLSTVELYDGTENAQKVFSAITRLEERFGAGYVVDFLRGSGASRIHEHHRTLRTFGAGADLSKDEWNSIIRDLLHRGYLTKTKGMYPLLALSDKCRDVLDGKTKVMLTKSKTVKEERQPAGKDYEKKLLQLLKEVRTHLAADENIPPHVVLSDASLMEIATYLPFNKNDFRRISGFGEMKIERYGRHFWQVVADYCTEHGLSSRMGMKIARVKRDRPERETDTKRQTLDLFRQGHGLEKIAVLRGLAVSTIESHLAYYVQHGKVQIDELLEPGDVHAIRRAIERADSPMLSVIRQSLGDEYSFGQIRLVLASIQQDKNEVNAYRT